MLLGHTAYVFVTIWCVCIPCRPTLSLIVCICVCEWQCNQVLHSVCVSVCVRGFVCICV